MYLFTGFFLIFKIHGKYEDLGLSVLNNILCLIPNNIICLIKYLYMLQIILLRTKIFRASFHSQFILIIMDSYQLKVVCKLA